MDKPQLAWIDPCYKGPLKVSGTLYKNKWSTGIGIIFGRYVKRFFVLDLENRKFCYYADSSCKSGSVYKFEVMLGENNGEHYFVRESNVLKILH